MDSARRLFEKIKTFKARPPRLTLPRRDAFNVAMSDKALGFLNDCGEKLLSYIEQTRLKIKRFIARQKRADWEARIEACAIKVTDWLAHPVVPKHLGVVLTASLMLASLMSGVYYGNHVPKIKEALVDLRDDAANVAGFQLQVIKLSGGIYLKEAEIREILALKHTKSLLYFDVVEAREKLLQEPWIADVKLTKNLPNELEIVISERKPAALWQNDLKITVIAADGKVLLQEIRPEFKNLPLLVGKTAAIEAKTVLEALDTFPEVKEKLRAAVLIADRNWRLLLKNGPEIKLPEKELSLALGRVMKLDSEQHILSKDIASIDVRLNDRMTVRLHEGAVEARASFLRDRSPKNLKEKSL